MMKRTAKKELWLITPGKAYKTRCIAKDLTGIELFKRACESTTGRTMTKQSAHNLLKKMYDAEHSPIRCRMFFIEIRNIPTFVCNHFVRHKVGVEFFCLSHRSDRCKVPDEQSNRLTPTSFSMLINAQALINMARKRLCKKASEETRKVMELIKDTIGEIDPLLALRLVPDCVYRGSCHEIQPCGEGENNGNTDN